MQIEEGEGTPELSELVERYSECLERVSTMESLINSLKDGPIKELKAKIIDWLNVHKQVSTRLANGLGLITLTTKSRVIYTDMELVCQHMYSNMVKAFEDGKPLIDELLLEQRPLQKKLTKWVEDALESTGLPDTVENKNKLFAPLGLQMHTVQDLSYTKRKK